MVVVCDDVVSVAFAFRIACKWRAVLESPLPSSKCANKNGEQPYRAGCVHDFEMHTGTIKIVWNNRFMLSTHVWGADVVM